MANHLLSIEAHAQLSDDQTELTVKGQATFPSSGYSVTVEAQYNTDHNQLNIFLHTTPPSEGSRTLSAIMTEDFEKVISVPNGTKEIIVWHPFNREEIARISL
tara:strand:+ start:301 stop:609 length:309 start_codon:yes stop_codon:yes gene_type:complete